MNMKVMQIIFNFKDIYSKNKKLALITKLNKS